MPCQRDDPKGPLFRTIGRGTGRAQDLADKLARDCRSIMMSWFAADSPLERSGFEPSVPRR
jgi:hypothetical protein